MKTLLEQLSENLINEEKINETNIKRIILKYNPKINKELLKDAVEAFTKAYNMAGTYSEIASNLEDDLAQMADTAEEDYYLLNAAINPDFFETYLYDVAQGEDKIGEIEDLIKKYKIK